MNAKDGRFDYYSAVTAAFNLSNRGDNLGIKRYHNGIKCFHRIIVYLLTVAGLPQQAKQIACVTEDFPVPLGPRITFNRGPGNTSQSSNVKKLCILTLKTEPLRYPFFFSSPTSPLPSRYSAVISPLSVISQNYWIDMVFT